MAKGRTRANPRTPANQPSNPEDDVELPPLEMAASTAAGTMHADLIAFLAEVNGQDAYDAKVAAVGKLSKAKYLKVPTGLIPVDTPTEEVGKANAAITDEIYAQIYVMNKAAFDGPEAQVKGALLRAELVRVGWYTGTYEVTVEPPPADWRTVMHADLPMIRDNHADATFLALLLPLATEHTFRTMGHHYLTSMEAEYVAKYNRFFSACVAPHLASYLPPAVLYHTVAHWTSLSKALDVVHDAVQESVLPNAVVIRATAAPAGMALLTTSAAILEAIAGTGLGQALEKASNVDIEAITDLTEEVRRNPAKFHTIPSAYGKGALSTSDVSRIAHAKTEARKLAPILQGFVDALPRSSDLASARALGKHADLNPMLRRRAKAFFSEVGKAKAANIAELFSMDKRSLASTKREDMEEAVD